MLVNFAGGKVSENMPVFSSFFLSFLSHFNNAISLTAQDVHQFKALVLINGLLCTCGIRPLSILVTLIVSSVFVSFNSHRPLSVCALWPDHNAFLSTTAPASPRDYLSLFGRPGSQNPLNRNNCARQLLRALLMHVTELFFVVLTPTSLASCTSRIC